LKEPRHQAEINQAREKRARHKLHTEAETNVITRSRGANDFLSWVQSILNNSATFARFVQLFRPPYATNELVEGIFVSFQKIFESKNGFQKFDFAVPEYEQDFEDYRKQIGDFNFWETQGMESFKNSIDDIIVVDLPPLVAEPDGTLTMQSDLPEPYYYMLDIDRLIDIENTKVIANKGDVNKEFYYFKAEYIAFRQPGQLTPNRLEYVFDDLYYRIFARKDGGEPIMIGVFEHGLNFCPARSFWTEPLNSDSNILKLGPITKSLSDLDWLLFFQIAERYLQLYAPFPIYAMYRRKCDYKEKVEGGTGKSCVNGWLEIPGSRFIGGERTPCPKCQEAGRVGPGHVMFFDPPRDKSDDPDMMANPMKVIPAEINSLDYVRKFIAEAKAEITVNCIGRSKDTNDATAKNEMQVETGMQSSESILLKAKRNFELIHEFALDTVARLRYGDAYLGGVVNYGDEFLQRTEDEEMQDYETASKNKMPVYDLRERRADIFAARYRNDPARQQRFKILENLEPFPDMDLAQLLEFKAKNSALISEIDVIIKMNFSAFIARFERERAPLKTFGSAIDFNRKIDLIREDLIAYAQEYKKAITPEPAPEPPPGPAPGAPVPPTPPAIKPEPALA
jgi:hypothetical protein